MDDKELQVKNDFKKAEGLDQVGFGLTLGGWIAFPVLLGFFIAKYVVNKFNLPEYVFYIIVGIFVVVSFYGLITNSIKYLKQMK